MLHLLDRGLAAVSVVATALVIVLLFAGPSLIGAKKSSTTGAASGVSAPSGSDVFRQRRVRRVPHAQSRRRERYGRPQLSISCAPAPPP